MSVLVSYLLFAFNHEEYVEEALRSALEQTYEPMEIIVTDDCSTDRTAQLVERRISMYVGSKKIKYIRNKENLGLGRVLNNAVSRAQGEILIAAAGDDISLPERSSHVVAAFDTDVHCVWSDADEIDQNDIFLCHHYSAPPPSKNIESFANPNMGLLGATAAYRRSVFDVFGPVNDDLLGEDRTMPLRAAILGKVAFVNRRLVLYRRHTSNLSSFGLNTVKNAESWFAFLMRNNRMVVSVLRQRVADITTGLRLFPEKHVELAHLRKTAVKQLMRAQIEDRLFQKPPLPVKLALTARVLTSGVNRRFARSWIKKFFFSDSFYQERRRRGRLGVYRWQDVWTESSD